MDFEGYNFISPTPSIIVMYSCIIINIISFKMLELGVEYCDVLCHTFYYPKLVVRADGIIIVSWFCY